MSTSAASTRFGAWFLCAALLSMVAMSCLGAAVCPPTPSPRIPVSPTSGAVETRLLRSSPEGADGTAAHGAANLSVHIGASRTVTDEGLPELFNATVTGSGPLTYVWNFGDNQTSSVAHPTHTYLIAGAMMVRLHLFGPNGTNATDSLAITVELPMALAGPTFPPTGAAGSSLSFTAFISGGLPPYTYYWQLGDHNISHELNTTHAYTHPGTYLAELWVNDSAGSQATFSEFVLIPYPSTGGGNGTAPQTSDWAYVGIAGGVVIVLVAIALFLARPPKTT